jgi:hypothetical protein
MCAPLATGRAPASSAAFAEPLRARVEVFSFYFYFYFTFDVFGLAEH